LRFFIWLAYLGSDAVAIYALATLFNRHKKPGAEGVSRGLEVFWAPVLLLHLAGQDSITAYNIEDNELWSRHVLTVISQVTVSIYVFSKSWSGESRLLRAAILLFIAGTIKCIDKPMSLKSASIYSLVTSAPFQDHKPISNDQGETSLETYIQDAKGYFATSVVGNYDRFLENGGLELRVTPFWLFVDLPSTLCHRLKVLHFFLILGNEKGYNFLQTVLCGTYYRLYTKNSMLLSYFWLKNTGKALKSTYAHLNRLLAVSLTISAVALFHQSHKDGYGNSDVKVTYTLLWCTAALEVIALFSYKYNFFSWCDRVAQYNLISSFARYKEPIMLLKLARCVGCKNYVDQHWYVEQCSSSLAITELVIEQVKAGWKDYIHGVSTYWTFNDRRGQLTLQQEGCYNELCWALEVPFDESVLVWHIATDICFFFSKREGSSDYLGCVETFHERCGVWCKRSTHHNAATRCRKISNHMVYLLVVSPDMLMAGTRASFFSDARKELGKLFKNDKPSSQELCITREIYRRAQSSSQEEAVIPRATKLASQLLALDDEKRWKVIQGVWVEMLCFSASRCRGYLHAKSLGMGGECLTYVWLLLWYMGLESVAERQQRSDSRKQEERAAKPSSPCIEPESSVSRTQKSDIQEDEEATAAPHASEAVPVSEEENV
ncbi:hypothetical protein EJB05_52659, partial [Eragrostis curvula]